MRHTAAAVLFVAGLAACEGGCGSPCTGDSCMTMPDPPQVFLIAPSSNVVGKEFSVRVNVSGCDIVRILELEQNGTVIKQGAYKGSNTEIVVAAGDLNRFYGTVGIAANLSLRAHAGCDDGRENRSTPVGVKFFPVESVVAPSNGQSIVMPDSFIAEGMGSSVSFVGCANVNGSLALVRMDLGGQALSVSPPPPFGCDYYGTISEKVAATGQRWLFQPGQGAFAFDSIRGNANDLGITGGVLGDTIAVFAVGPDGDALVWDNMASTAPAMAKIRHNAAISQVGIMAPNTAWQSAVPGIVNGTPVFDQGLALVPSWRVPLGSRMGTQTIQRVDWNLGGNPVSEKALVTQSFEFLDPQNPPQVAFSPDARTIYIVTPIQGSPNQSAVIACGTQGTTGGCTKRWTAGPLNGVAKYLISYNSGTKLAAISDNMIWFIDDTPSGGSGGAILNPNGVPTAVSGQLLVSGAQAGIGTDFYLLAGTPFASEIIAFDTPNLNEVWRYSTEGGGQTPQTSITMAIDDSGQSWLRVGVNQVKPSSLAAYRQIRGSL